MPKRDRKKLSAQFSDSSESFQSREPVAVSADAVARRAYELFEARGAQPGRDVDDWLRAEQELTKQH